ncbi:MAG: GAF domain-containing protein [Planctomycetota bacterium]|nr:MAG: GAF domain-containing protein [Planctomycetota bacterium]
MAGGNGAATGPAKLGQSSRSAPVFRPTSRPDSGDPDRSAERRRVLLDALADLASTLDLDEVLDRILARSLDLSGAERALLLLGGGAGDGLWARRARGPAGPLAAEEVPFSSSVVRAALERGEPIIHELDSDSQALAAGRSVYELRLRSVMCAPLAAGGETLGAIYLDSRVQHKVFTGEDRDLFQALARQAALAVRNARLLAAEAERARMERELELAAEIQRDLLPERAPELAGLEVAGRMVPSTELGGDFYDFVPLADGRLALFVADVAGHGVGPALVAAEVRGEIRALLPLEPDPGRLLDRVHRNLCETLEPERFLTLILALVDPAGRLAWANAGHAEALVLRGGEAVWLGRTGPPLGVDAPAAHRSRTLAGLRPGDTLLLCSDGVAEARAGGGSCFGRAGIEGVLRAGGPAPALVERLLTEAAAFHAAGEKDDRTAVAVRWR